MKNFIVVARLHKSDRGFSVTYTWPSPITGGMTEWQADFDTNVKAIKFADDLRDHAEAFGFECLVYGFNGSPFRRKQVLFIA